MSASARVPTDPRFRRRRKVIERWRRRKLLVGAITVAAAVAGAWLAFWSPLLAVDEVQVTGARYTSTADIARVTGLDANDNLLLVSPREVAEKAEKLPWVKSAEVDRMLPGLVRVRIEERKPAFVLSVGAARWTLDGDGRVLVAGEAKKGLPVLAGVDLGAVEVGRQVRGDAVVGALPLPTRLRRQIVAIFAPTVERITLSLARGMLVRYGGPERVAAKNEVLTAVLARVRRDKSTVAYVDVRVPTSPAISPTSTPQPIATFPILDG